MKRGIIIGIIIAVAIAIGFGVLTSSDNVIQSPETGETAETEVTAPRSYSVLLEESVSASASP